MVLPVSHLCSRAFCGCLTCRIQLKLRLVFPAPQPHSPLLCFTFCACWLCPLPNPSHLQRAVLSALLRLTSQIPPYSLVLSVTSGITVVLKSIPVSPASPLLPWVLGPCFVHAMHPFLFTALISGTQPVPCIPHPFHTRTQSASSRQPPGVPIKSMLTFSPSIPAFASVVLEGLLCYENVDFTPTRLYGSLRVMPVLS